MKKAPMLLFLALVSYGHLRADPLPGPGDSLLPVRTNLVVSSDEHFVETELEEIESGYLVTGDHRRTLNKLLKMFGSQQGGWNKRMRYRLYDDLAHVSARLRLYPLAMKCFYNASRQADGLPADSSLYRGDTVAESMPIAADSIRLAFADGRDAVAYALLVEVKQPVPGKRKAFTHINNVGHTFITLIKYNRDSSVISRSFGFYPYKGGMLDATPLHPNSPSVIKDDSRHEWDELAGKFITERQFHKIIEALQTYEGKVYNLNHRNCTDFGLTMAGIGGIGIERSIGPWPLGRGNNPGSAGQSMLEGKVSNLDLVDTEPLFVAKVTSIFRNDP